jgi:hypothetical protein
MDIPQPVLCCAITRTRTKIAGSLRFLYLNFRLENVNTDKTQICDSTFADTSRPISMADVPPATKLNKEFISYLQTFVSATIIHEVRIILSVLENTTHVPQFTHAAKYRLSDVRYGWDEIMKLDTLNTLNNADSYSKSQFGFMLSLILPLVLNPRANNGCLQLIWVYGRFLRT